MWSQRQPLCALCTQALCIRLPGFNLTTEHVVCRKQDSIIASFKCAERREMFSMAGHLSCLIYVSLGLGI